MADTDFSTGLVLTIDDSVLQQIKKAEENIGKLGETSKKVAEQIKGDFGSVMVEGVDAFIKKLQEAQGKLGNISVKTPFEKTNDDAKAAMQNLGTVIELLNKLTTASSAVGSSGMNIAQLTTEIENLRNKLQKDKGVTPREEEQRIVNLLRYYEEEKRLLMESTQMQEAKAKAEQKKDDTAVLAEQNRLLNERLKIERQLHNISVIEGKNTELGKKKDEILSDAQVKLKAELEARKKEIEQLLSVLNSKMSQMSVEAQQKYDTRDIQAQIEMQKELVRYQTAYEKAIANAKELKKDSAASALQPSSEALSAKREMMKLSNEILKIYKEYSAVQAKGDIRGFNSAAENKYLSELIKRQEELQKQLDALTKKYPGLAAAINKKRAAQIDAIDALERYRVAQQKAENADKAAKKDIQGLVKEYRALAIDIRRLKKAKEDAASVTDDNIDISNEKNSIEQKLKEAERRKLEIEAEGLEEIDQLKKRYETQELQRAIALAIEKQKKNAEYAKSFGGIPITYNDVMDMVNNDKDYNTTYQKREEAIKKVEAALKNLSTTDVDYKTKQTTLIEILKQLKKEQEEYNDAINRVTVSEAKNAVAKANQSRSLKDSEEAIKKLKLAMSTMDSSSKQWKSLNQEYQTMKKRVDDIKKAMGDLKDAQASAAAMGRQLKNILIGAFSVRAIWGYINKIKEVRAQFELQQVALRAILNDKEKADEVFSKVQQMALQSPFSIMQMNTFVKQLAAYRIESDKLVDTTKMLADVSAGLGVDMSRLILAYGQVKSANYLRASEIRQFTEAGLNIAGELATYFTEIEGKGVSVADVMERVTKRMVRFEDVEEVFKRVTSAGGLFYDMQKKQSETLWGQMQRLTDAINIMLNEIGKDNQSLFSDIISGLRWLISNWQSYSRILKTILGGIGIYATINGIVKLINYIKALRAVLNLAAMSATGLSKSLLLFASSGAGMVITAIGLIVSAIVLWKSEAEQLKETMQNISDEVSESAYDAVNNIIRLVNIISDQTKSYDEQKEAVDELKRSYGEILPKELLEIEAIQNLAGNYSILTDKVIEYYQALEYKKKLKALSDSDAIKNFTEELSDAISKTGTIYSKSLIENFSKKIAQEILESGKTVSKDFVKERVSNYFGANIADKLSVPLSELRAVNAELNRISITVQKINESATEDSALNFRYSDIISYNYALQKIDTINKQKYKNEQDLALLKTYQTLKETLEPIIKARNKLLAQDIAKQVDNETNALTKQIQTYYSIYTKVEQLKEVGKEGTEQFETLSTQLEQSLNGIIRTNVFSPNMLSNVTKTLGLNLSEEISQYNELANQLKNLKLGSKDYENVLKQRIIVQKQIASSILAQIHNEKDLKKVMESLSIDVFPKFVLKNIRSLDEMDSAFFKTKETTIDFLSELKGLKTTDYANSIASLANNFSVLSDNLDDATKKIMMFKSATSQKVDDGARGIALDLLYELSSSNVDINLIEKVMSRSLNDAQNIAKDLRTWAKEQEEYRKSFNLSKNKSEWIKANNLTELELAQMERAAQTARQIADIIWGEEDKENKKKNSKDAVLDRWKRIKEAIEAVGTQYDKLHKTASKFESSKRIEKEYSEVFQRLGVNISDYFKDGNYNLEETYQALLRLQREIQNSGELTNEARKEFEKSLKLEANKRKVDFQIDIDQKSIDDVKNRIDEIFRNYELTKSLIENGLNPNMAFVVGGDRVSFQDLKDLIESLKMQTDGSEQAENLVKVFEDAYKKIADIENNNAIEQLKNYNKYLLESMSDRLRIEVETQKEIAKIRQNETLNDESKNMAIENANKEKQKKLAELDWNDFKNSTMYVDLFQNIEQASNKMLSKVRNKLSELKANLAELPANDLKTIVEQINKIDEQMIAKNPFRAALPSLIKYISKLKERRALERIYEENQQYQEDAKKELDLLQTQFILADERYQIVKSENDEYSEKVVSAKNLRDVLAGQLKIQKEYLDNLVKSGILTKEQIDAITQEGKLASNAFSEASDYTSTAASGIGDLKNNIEGVFGTMSDELSDAFDSLVEVLNGLSQFESGISEILNGKIFTGAIHVVTGAFGAIAGIFGFGDKKKERQIKKLQEKVDNLAKAYENLQNAMERTYTFESYNSDYSDMLKNIDEQKKKTEEMLDLEKSKKKYSKDQIKEYEEQLQELEDKRKEILEKRYEDFGSLTASGYRSEAESWVDAWLDAYKETGDGLDSLKDSWQDFYEQIVLKQAASSVVSKRMAKYIDAINAAIDSGSTGLSLAQTYKEIGEKFKNEFNDINTGLKEFFDALGFDTGKLGLSDLQKGIQNITEPQAAAIEAYMNSIRFAVFEQNAILSRMLNAIMNQYVSYDSTPLINEMKLVRSVVESIDQKLGRVIVRKNGGHTDYILKTN